MNTNELLEGILKKVHDLSAEVKVLKEKKASPDQEKLEKRLLDIESDRTKLRQEFEVARRGRFEADDESETSERKNASQILVAKATDARALEFQKFNDRVYLLSKILKVHPSRLNYWKQGMKHDGVSELKKAMDTATSQEGAEWIPTQFSADLNDRVRLAMKVAGLHKHIPMPTNPFKLPVAGADGTGYLIGESGADGTDDKITASTPGTANLTLTAKKLAARILYSEEVSEDSIIATSDYVLDQIAQSLANAIEDAIINGDTSGTHMDNDVTAATDRRKAFNGYRKSAQDANQTSLASFTTTQLRAMRAKMGKYGVYPNKLAWITGPKGYAKFLSVAEVLTVDKYGSLATVLTGEIGKFDGVPIIISEFIRETLGTTGVKDSTSAIATEVLLVYLAAFLIGDRRKVTIKTWEDIERDQTVVVGTVRHAFGSLYDVTTEPVAVEGVNVATS